MDVLRKLIFMLMSIHKYNAFDIQRPEEIPPFDIALFLCPPTSFTHWPPMYSSSRPLTARTCGPKI